jgi:CPA2 family monovalent cation:H+ antiporter-2
MLAYLAVGILIGPHAFGLVGDNETMHALAEFGVVFLMFSIGLEFSLPQLMSMRRLVFGLGMAQVLISIAVVMAVSLLGAYWLPSLSGITWQAAFALSGAMAMSSTAIVSKMMAERLELETEHGRRIFGILLFQDLALVPLLIVVPALANNPKEVWMTLGLAVGKAIVVLVLLLLVGQKLMRKWFHVVVKRKSQELFMLNLLLITLGAAWITQMAGLSLELGAFVAGMLISETRYRHQVEADIQSFIDRLQASIKFARGRSVATASLPFRQGRNERMSYLLASKFQAPGWRRRYKREKRYLTPTDRPAKRQFPRLRKYLTIPDHCRSSTGYRRR